MDADLLPDFRRAARRHLAERPAVSQPAVTVNRYLHKEFGSTVEDTENALRFCEGLGHLKSTYDPMGGSERYFQITATGILAHERGE